MKAFNQHLPIAKIGSDALTYLIEESSGSFDVMIFPAGGAKEDVTDGGVIDIVANMESHEREFEYGDPVYARALEPPRTVGFSGLSNGEGYGIEGSEEPLRLLISQPVPKRSVLAYLIEQHDGTMNLQVLYLLSSKSIGTKSPIGYMHTFMPFIGGALQMGDGSVTTSDMIDLIKQALADTPPPP